MKEFPRTTAGGVSLPRLIIGTNWFRGYSHTSHAKDKLITGYMTTGRITDILEVFMNAGVDAAMWSDLEGLLPEAAAEAEQRTGRRLIRILTPRFNLKPGGPPEMEPERAIARCRDAGATFCLPHQSVTDALADRRDGVIRDLDHYTKMIRDNGMIPGLSTHMPEVIRYADAQDADAETYIQIYNALGFLMQIEADWVMRVIQEAKKPVMAIKPLAAGALTPPVGLAFVWNTIRGQDMVVIGTMSPDEAREVIDISFDYLERRLPGHDLQTTASKQSLA